MRLIESKFLVALLLALTYTSVNADVEGCRDISGKWINQLQSTFVIHPVVNNRFIGEYSTGVESYNGSAGTRPAKVIGVYLPSGLLSHAVIFNNGSSATVWVGECVVCNGVETLFTSWALRSYTTPDREWTSTRFHQDTYVRVLVPGVVSLPPPPVVDEGSNDIDEHIGGNWYNELGEEIKLAVQHRNDIENVLNGTFSELPSSIYGMSIKKNNYYALVFTAYNSDTDEVQSWTGHINNAEEPSSEGVMKTSWLKHSRVGNCKYARRSTSAGLDVFTRNRPSEDHFESM